MGAEVRLSWRVTELMASMLAPAEREAVLGDLAESNRTFFAGLGDIAGLAMRRGAATCCEVRTAIGFFVAVLPLSLLLTDMARRTASSAAVSVWFWTNNLDLHLLANAGFWHGVAEGAPGLLLACAMLALYGWSAATLAGCISRGAATLLCLVLFLTTITGAPTLYPAPVLPVLARHGNDAVFQLAFYRIVFPRLVQCIFVLLPALFALRNPPMEIAR